MKKLFFVSLLIVIICFAKQIYAQQKLSKKNLIGVWQYGSPHIGDELGQSFAFFDNGNFIFYNGKNGDDVVSTLNLKGKYRLDEKSIYFTIISRMMVDKAQISIIDPGIKWGIFEYGGDDETVKEIVEKDPKEIADPATFTIIAPNHIKINDEEYYKVSSNPNDAIKLM